MDNFGKQRSGFSTQVIIPIISGMLGAIITIGFCFSIPSIRERILGVEILSDKPKTVLETSTPLEDINLVSLSNYSDTAIAVADKVRPSIVGIDVEYSVTSMFGTGTAQGQGSGIIISEDGYILTNNHIINSESPNSFYTVSEANKVIVYLYNDTTEYEAKIIGTDSQTDLAIVKIEKTGLTPVEIGNSDNIKVGEFAMAIGNPLGMQSSVTSGIISAIDRKVGEVYDSEYSLIQTDAAINAGNSGGALVNSKGQVIGVNSLKFAGNGVEGMGFAIPINATKSISEELIAYGKIKRPYIGISGIDLDEQTAKRNNLPIGIYIKTVEDLSPAQKYQLKTGDVILEIDSTKINTMDELNKIKATHKIGDEVSFKISRDNKEMEIKLILGEQP